MRYFLCLGSNLGPKKANLAEAVLLLENRRLKILKASSLYETQPVGLTDQPWFLNQVIEVESGMAPASLLTAVKEIERQMGRMSSDKRSRIIDIDILLAEETVMKTETLEIPHPRLEKRNFVLIPLKEIAPDVVHPILHSTIEELWKESPDRSKVRQVVGEE